VQNARRAGRRFEKEDFQRVHDRVHADAERKVRAGLLMAAIARKLDIKISDDDVQRGLQELAADSGKNIAKVRAEYQDPQRRQILIGMILEDKVLDIIESKAQIRIGASQPTSSEGDAPERHAPTP
jgi:trigger factor